jgi:starch phosphorylase
MCTCDGANIEIADECSHENSYEFGLRADDVDRIKSRGYNATEYYINSERVRSVIDKMNNGIAGESFADLVGYLLGHTDYKDSYMCLADFDSYIDAYERMEKEYADQEFWSKKVLHCVASMGLFSSDRAIEEYATKIWNLKKNVN